MWLTHNQAIYERWKERQIRSPKETVMTWVARRAEWLVLDRKWAERVPPSIEVQIHFWNPKTIESKTMNQSMRETKMEKNEKKKKKTKRIIHFLVRAHVRQASQGSEHEEKTKRKWEEPWGIHEPGVVPPISNRRRKEINWNWRERKNRWIWIYEEIQLSKTMKENRWGAVPIQTRKVFWVFLSRFNHIQKLAICSLFLTTHDFDYYRNPPHYRQSCLQFFYS